MNATARQKVTAASAAFSAEQFGSNKAQARDYAFYGGLVAQNAEKVRYRLCADRTGRLASSPHQPVRFQN